MGKAIVLILAALFNRIIAAHDLSERASKVESSLPTDLDGTTILKAAAPAAKARVASRPNKYPARLKKQNTFFIDDPEIFTDKKKSFGGTTLESVGKAGEGVRANERADWRPRRFIGDQPKEDRKWVGKGTKQKKGFFSFIDDPERFTDKKKSFGGTTVDSVGKAGVGVRANEAAGWRPRRFGSDNNVR